MPGSSPLRVSLLSGEFPPMQGGVGDYTKELSRALAQQGLEVSIITRREGSADGVGWAQVFPVVSGWEWNSWQVVIDIMKAIHPQILHIQYQTAAFGMHPAINFLPLRLRLVKQGPRSVVTFHDLRVPYLFPKAGPARIWVTKTLARWSDAVIVTNREDEIRIKAYLPGLKPYLIPISSNIPALVPPGYRRDAWRAQWGVGPETTLLSYFGLLNESKGAESLVQALDRLVATGYEVALLMVGGRVGASDPTNLAYAERVGGLIDQLGLRERVFWTGYIDQEEVSANLLASDICVLPYRDGASFRRGSLMAALAHGLPIVSTYPQVEILELVEGENISLVPPDDVEALVERIASLISDRGKRERLGRGAGELAEAFTWESIAREAVSVYRQLLSSI